MRHNLIASFISDLLRDHMDECDKAKTPHIIDSTNKRSYIIKQVISVTGIDKTTLLIKTNNNEAFRITIESAEIEF